MCGELPVGFGVMLVAMVLPSGDLCLESLLVWDATAETLARQSSELGFGHVEPAPMFGGVMPLCAAENYGGRSDDLTT